MNETDIRNRLTTVFRDTFEQENIEINDDMTAADITEWDSISHINLILGVEKEFNIRLATREVRGMKNIGDFIALIMKKQAS